MQLSHRLQRMVQCVANLRFEIGTVKFRHTLKSLSLELHKSMKKLHAVPSGSPQAEKQLLEHHV